MLVFFCEPNVLTDKSEYLAAVSYGMQFQIRTSLVCAACVTITLQSEAPIYPKLKQQRIPETQKWSCISGHLWGRGATLFSPKTVSNSPSSNQPISRSCCWQQSHCMFGLIALHPWYNPSLMRAHILPGSLGKVPEMYMSEQWGRWQLWHWNESAPTEKRKWCKLGKCGVNLDTEAIGAGMLGS